MVEYPALSSHMARDGLCRLHHLPVRHSVPTCAVRTLVPHGKAGVFASYLYKFGDALADVTLNLDTEALSGRTHCNAGHT